MRTLTLVTLLVVSLLLFSCGPAIKHPVTVNEAKTLALSYPQKAYVIQPGDSLDVKFFYNPELNESLIVRPDGKISLQLAPGVMAAGLTPRELTDVLTKAYSQELANPGIAVILRSFASQKVHVDGEVNKPGLVTLVGTMTALEAIAEAGGFKDTARLKEVLIIRKAAPQKPVTIVADMESAIYGADKTQNITLAPYDIIFVPRSPIANVNTFVDQYIRKNVPIPFGLSYGFGPRS